MVLLLNIIVQYLLLVVLWADYYFAWTCLILLCLQVSLMLSMLSFQALSVYDLLTELVELAELLRRMAFWLSTSLVLIGLARAGRHDRWIEFGYDLGIQHHVACSHFEIS